VKRRWRWYSDVNSRHESLSDALKALG
jgi:hypothetical protein